jgi:hypothetical protein
MLDARSEAMTGISGSPSPLHRGETQQIAE